MYLYDYVVTLKKDSECEFVEQQLFFSLSLSSENAKKIVALENGTETRMEWKASFPRGLRTNECSSARWNNTWRKVKVSEWKSASWSISCLDKKMQITTLRLSQKKWGWSWRSAFAEAAREAGRGFCSQKTAMAIDEAQLFLVLDAVHAWTSRDRVIARMTTHSVFRRAERLCWDEGTCTGSNGY